MMSATASLTSSRGSTRSPCTLIQETFLQPCFPTGSTDLPVYPRVWCLHTDPSIRNEEGFRKNVDDILTSAASVQQLEVRLKKLLTICRNRNMNMKLSPSKFQVGSSKTVFLSPTQQKLDAFLDFPTPSCKKDVQSIMGAAAQLKCWTPGLMLLSPNLQKLTGNSTPSSGMMICRGSWMG